LRDSFPVLSDFKGLRGGKFPFLNCSLVILAARQPEPRTVRRAPVPHLVGSRLPSPYHLPARIQSFQAVAAPFPGDFVLPSASPRRRRGNSGQRKPAIAVEFPRELYHPVDRLEIALHHHRARDDHRFAQLRDLQLNEAGGRVDPRLASISLMICRTRELLNPRDMRDRESDRQPLLDPKPLIRGLAARRGAMRGAASAARAGASWGRGLLKGLAMIEIRGQRKAMKTGNTNSGSQKGKSRDSVI
jgi:hypothetical protein